MQKFAQGFYVGTGSNTSTLKIVVGTNNSGSYSTTAGGAAWAQLVIDCVFAISGYASQVTVVGGNDIEMGYSTMDKVTEMVEATEVESSVT